MRNTKFLTPLINSIVPFAILKIGLIVSLLLVALTFSNCAAQAQTNKNLNRTWTRQARHYGGNLKITKATKTKFNFVISTMNGANMGEVSGTAFLKKGKYVFTDAALAKREQREVCELIFEPRKNLIEVTQNLACQTYAGNAVFFHGDFTSGKYNTAGDSLFGFDVFPNQNIDRKFKTLVGADYEKFLDAFHIVYDDIPNDDSFPAKVVNGCVRGVCPYNAAMIMYDEKGKFWAIVIEGGDEYYYYSNDADYRRKLPETIKKWQIENNPNAKIIYRNGK